MTPFAGKPTSSGAARLTDKSSGGMEGQTAAWITRHKPTQE